MSMNVLAMMGKALSAWGSVKDVALGDVSIDTINKLASIFGHDVDPSHAEAIALLCKDQGSDESVGGFITGGGLMRLVASIKSGGEQSAEVLPSVTRCPFCNELHT